MSSPGWYPQPDGSERFYDGNDWTDQVRAPQAGGPVPPPMEQPKKKSGVLKWIAIGIVIVVLICCGAALLNMGGDDESAADATSVSESAESSDEEAAAEPATKETASKAKKDEPKKEKAKKPEKKASAPDVTITAGELLKEFEGNELAGDTKYKGKTIQVSGVVEKIDTELFNEDKCLLNITDGGDFEFLSVTCHDMSTDVLSTLSVGNPVTVIGDFDDGGDLGVELKDCKLA